MLTLENRLGRGVIFLLALALSISAFCLDCRAGEQAQISPRSKITFNLEGLNENGLYGPPEGLRALHYEFCIPGNPVHEDQVRQIDPTIKIFKFSRGRAGCSKGEYLCVGSTHQPHFKTILVNLAKLPFIKRIDQAFFE